MRKLNQQINEVLESHDNSLTPNPKSSSKLKLIQS